MGTRYNADEIIEIAIEIEKNGSAFYERAAEKIGEAQGGRLMRELADWEKTHIRIFERLRETTGGSDEFSASLDPNGEAALYLQAIADGKIFPLGSCEKDLEELPDGIEALLEMAIAREKDAVIFYLAMKDMVPQEMGRSAVTEIVAEEMSHVRFLSEELNRVRQETSRKGE